MTRFKSVCPAYTGGGIYVFTGELEDGNFFMSDTACYDVRILNANPDIPDDMPDEESLEKYGVTRDEDAWGSVEWQEEHLVGDLSPDEAVKFFKAMFRWIRKHQPDDDLKYYEDEVKTLKGNWR